MTPPESAPPPGAEQLLAVACPTCFGAIAVGAELFGRPADCPLCGGGFNVPLKAAPAPPAAAAGQPQRPLPPSGEAASSRDDERGGAAGTTVAAGTMAAAVGGEAASGTALAPDGGAAAAPFTTAPAPLSPAAGIGTTAAFDQPLPDPAAAAARAELAFREPVVTVGSGDNVIELRRLTPEEKAQRRARRNVVMLLTGVSILMAMVLSLGRSRR
jgi:hypothetical protein